MRRLGAVLATTLVAASVASAGAQMADSGCTYARCALGILPRLSGLDVVRGAGEQRVASLGFLLPRNVTPAFSGDRSAEAHAAGAVRRRRVAAVLTDLGAIAIAMGTMRRSDAGHRVALAGLAFVASSVPIHFAADAELSRAVWIYDRRFGEPHPVSP
ncbi:MAG: hypothetical protein ACREPM_02965 [Gemmatimonadaceae bacterium]